MSFHTKPTATTAGAPAIERMSIEQNGTVRIGATSASTNNLSIANRMEDWDNNSYYVDPAGANVLNEVQGDAGSTGDPSFTFRTDNNTGLYSPGGGQLGITIDGTQRGRFYSNGLNMNNNNINGTGYLETLGASSYSKLRVWNSSSYAIGMVNAQTYGYLNDYAMTFTMNNDSDRGFLWRDASDAASDGAMSLTTDGRLTVKNTTRLQSLSGTGNRMVVASSTGVLSASGLTGFVNVNNGLNYNSGGNAIRLGGALIQNTNVNQGAYSMNFNLNSTGDFNLMDNGTIITHFRDDGVIFHGDDMYWRDGSYTGTNLMALFDDGNDGRLLIYENGGVSVDLDANSQFVFKEQSGDRNLRVESNNDTYNLFSDAGLDRVGIGESAPKTRLHIAQGGGQTLMLERADASTTSGEQLGGIGFDSGDGNTPDDIKESSASIVAFASESHGTGDKGGRLEIWTSPTNQNDDTDGFRRVRFDQDGETEFYYDVNLTDDDLWDVGRLTVNTIYDTDGAQVVHFDPNNDGSLLQVRFDVGAGATRDIWMDEYANHPHIRPGTANYGYIGRPSNYWRSLYANNIINVSRRETKRDILAVTENRSIEEHILSDIDGLKPSLYKYRHELDDIVEGDEASYRPQYHLGLILEETPDYLQDNEFTGIDIYSLAAMSMVGVKSNREEIKAIKEGRGKTKINDFGSARMNNNNLWVSFDTEFSDQLTNGEIPVVNITVNALGAEVAVTEKTSRGFRIEKVGTNPLNFDWFAIAKVVKPTELETSERVPSNVLDQLVVPQAAKDKSRLIEEADRRSHEADSYPEPVDDMGSDEEDGYMGGPNPDENSEVTPIEQPPTEVSPLDDVEDGSSNDSGQVTPQKMEEVQKSAKTRGSKN